MIISILAGSILAALCSSTLLFSIHSSENLITVVSSSALRKTSQGGWVSLLV